MKKENLISVFCQLKNRKINVGECYDIQMVINGYIKPEALSEQISFENANSVCTFCKYNQLMDGDELADLLHYIKNELPYQSQIKKNGFIIHFHDSFVFEYNWNEQYSRINGKKFYDIELFDIEDYVRQLAGGYDVIIQYKKRLFHKIPFKLVDARKFKLKQPIGKSVEKIFTNTDVIYENTDMN